MNKFIERIENDIEKIKVIKSKEEYIKCESNFINITKGEYYLNNNRIIKRECITNKIGNGYAICIFAVTEDKKILLVIQPRVVTKEKNGISIEIPAGYAEGEENWKEIIMGVNKMMREKLDAEIKAFEK